ncbi:MAG: DUF5107 domain-containing protein [Reichenbachiella sp.]
MTFTRNLILLGLLMACGNLYAQVELRDSTITWQHHEFVLNEDNGMQSWATDDDQVQEVTFQAKVIENELIRLVVVPEYGARVLSFYYKPTQHEYLYQSECGTPYGMNDGNFYYDWLMVWGGIFPTFPEPEHGKTWLVPWDLEVITSNEDTVTLQMSYTDESSFSGAPSSFNNGVTNITCEVSVSVYRNMAAWDFDVQLTNNKSTPVNYEYWTCTTMTPGSDPGDTASPLNSELIIPAESYFAGWSPGAWIGNNNQYYPLSDIDYLDEWSNMGIGYVDEFSSNYWGVINHDNEEGIMRISDQEETPSMKLWAWGRGNVDNDMFDFSNGGADNYIELWAGVSRSFFTDATLAANEVKSWKETYAPTVMMSNISSINAYAAMHLNWDQTAQTLAYEINTYEMDQLYDLVLYIEEADDLLIEETLEVESLGYQNEMEFEPLSLTSGHHTVVLELYDADDVLVLSSEQAIIIEGILGLEEETNVNELILSSNDNRSVQFGMTDGTDFEYQVYAMNGQVIEKGKSIGQSVNINFAYTGLYIIKVSDAQHGQFVRKIAVR